MNTTGSEEAVLSREELDALLAEMPQLLEAESEEAEVAWPRSVDLELQRANALFATEQAQALSNRHQRVISIHLIGHRDVDLPELAEMMLPTDLAAGFRVMPKGFEGYLLLSRPFFFQLLSMSFGAGPTIKPTRPPVRDYSRIERRFYARAANEMVDRIGSAWSTIMPVALDMHGLVSRASVAEVEAAPVVLATFEVRGFGEACRIRLAIPAECFGKETASPDVSRIRSKRGPEVSLEKVPIRLRAEVGEAKMNLGEIGRLRVGDLIPIETSTDGHLRIRVGERVKFKAIAGVQGARRAVQLTERVEGRE